MTHATDCGCFACCARRDGYGPKWPVRHPGIGVLYYDSEEEARIAAGTAAEMLRPATSLRLVVPSPGSWLTGFDPEAANARWALEALWRVQARTSLLAAESDEWHRLAPSWKARVLVRPVEVARTGLLGIHQAEDVRPSWHAVREVLSASGVQVAREVMSLGAVDPHGGQLVVELRPLVVRR